MTGPVSVESVLAGLSAPTRAVLARDVARRRAELEPLHQEYLSLVKLQAALEELERPPRGETQRDKPAARRRDMDRSWARGVRLGERTAYIYEQLVELVTKHFGGLSCERAQELLNEKTGVSLPTGRLNSYVTSYNKLHPDKQRLMLWPPRAPGLKRSRGYHEILLSEPGAGGGE